MTVAAGDSDALERKLDALFIPECDPYRAGAAVLFDKPLDMILQAERDLTKCVFMRMAARRGYTAGEPALRRAADMFHEIVSAFEARRLLDREGHKLPQVLYDDFTRKLRSPLEITKVAADGFELCVRALAGMGATDVTIHECGEKAFGEQPWISGDDT